MLTHLIRPRLASLSLLGFIIVAAIVIRLTTPFIANRFITEATTDGSISTLLTLAMLTIVLAVVGQGFAIVETRVAENMSWEATNALRRSLTDHVLRLDRQFHVLHTPGELVERIDGDVGTLSRFVSRFLVLIVGNMLMVVGLLVLLIVIDWRIGVTVAAIGITGLVLMFRIRSRSTHQWNAERQGSADFYSFLGEYLASLEDLRSLGASPFAFRRFTESLRVWFVAVRDAQMRGYALVAVSQGVFGIGAAVALGMSAILYRQGSIALGVVYLVYRYASMLRDPIEQIRNEIQDLQQADASIIRMNALFSTDPLVKDTGRQELPIGPLDLRFESVSFGYGEGDVLRDITFFVAAGRTLGIIGRTGSGKTSLTRLIPRFHDPDQGRIMIGGIDIRETPLAALRARIGLIGQDIHIFRGAVRDNLTLFESDSDDNALIALLESVGLADWIARLPNGLDTEIGGPQTRLSAGQAQLLASARILLRDPDLVILDEASSRLDPAAERTLHRALDRLLAHRTGLIIAHRLETLDFADDILVLENGRIREYGERLALASNPGSRYATLLREARGATL